MANSPDTTKAPTPLALAPMAPLTPLAAPAPMFLPPALHAADASLAAAPHLVALEAARPLHALDLAQRPARAVAAPAAPPAPVAPAPAAQVPHAPPPRPPPPPRAAPSPPPQQHASRSTPRTPAVQRPATTTTHVGTPRPITPPPAAPKPASQPEATPSWPKGLVLEPETPAQRPGTQPLPGPHRPHPPRRPGGRPTSDGSKGGVGWLIGLGLLTLMLRNCKGCKDDEPQVRRPGPSRPDSVPSRVDRPLTSTELKRLHQLRRAHEEGEALTAAERRELLELERRARAR